MRTGGGEDADAVLRALGGSARRAEILRRTTLHALRRAVADGSVVRRGPGVYAVPGAGPERSAALVHGGLLSHGTAASHWLMEKLVPDERIHVTVPRGSRRPPGRRVTLHYSDVAPHDEIGHATSPLRTVLDCAGTMPFAEALAIADSALRRGLVSPGELREAADRCRGPARRRQRRVASAADGRADNPFESALRAIVLEAGIAGFRPQLEIDAGTGYRVDLGDERRRIVLEADSFTHHGTPAALERDCRRYDELVRAGWLVLRFAWPQVLHEPQWVARCILDTCALADHRTRSRRIRPSHRPHAPTHPDAA